MRIRYTPLMLAFFRRWKFPFLLAAGLILVQALLALFISRQAGPDRVWLGDYLWNSADQAVYFTYIEQAKQGAFTFKNFYAPLDADRFIHLTYVPIGWIAALFQLSPIVAHEVGRWITTLIAVCLVYRLVQSSTDNEREARVATTTVVLGGGFGWMVVVKQAMTGFFPADFAAAADVTSETFFFPTIIGGAHIILSAALLVYGLHRLWIEIEPDSPSRLRSLASITTLFLLHPYFVPLVGIYLGIAAICKRLSLRHIFRLAFVYGPFWLLAIAPHTWSQWQDPYRRFFLAANHLPLGSFVANLFSFLPWLGFIAWRFHRYPLKEREYWILAWTAAALILISFPQIHFKRKMLEGLAIGILLLAFPVWKDVLMWAKLTGKIAYVGMWAMILLSPLSLIQSQVAWVTRPMGRGDEFFLSQDIAKAWEWIRISTPTSTIVLTDDVWVGVWTPPNTGRHVWIGHDHETPDWKQKKQFIQDLFAEEDPIRVQMMLNDTNAEIVVTTRAENSRIMQEKAGSNWSKEKVFGNVALWSKKTP